MIAENHNPFFRPFLIAIILAFGAYLLSGCKTPAKMLRKHDKIQAKCEGKKSLDTVGASWCNTNYPVEAKTTVKTKYVRGKTIVKVDTNTVTEVVRDTVLKTVTVNRWHTQVDTQYIDTSKVLVNNRKVDLLEGRIRGKDAQIANLNKSLDKSIKDRDKAIDGRNKWRKYALWTWAIIVLYISVRIIRSRFNVFMNGLG